MSFDPHVEEIAGSLISSAQLVILKPDPYHLDMDYLLTTIARYQVTFLGTVPTTLIMLTDILRSLSQVNQDSRLRSLCCIVSGGLSYKMLLIYLSSHCSETIVTSEKNLLLFNITEEIVIATRG